MSNIVPNLQVIIPSTTAVKGRVYRDIIVKPPVPALPLPAHCQINIYDYNASALVPDALTGERKITGENVQVGFLTFTFKGCTWTKAGKFGIDADVWSGGAKKNTAPLHGNTIIAFET